ncbi:MAG: NosD domain-containing protein, partial [Candidatus Aenigmatarchaeota archaeon]
AEGGSSGNAYLSNTVKNSTQIGIYIESGSSENITGNTLSSNQIGIYTEASDSLILHGNAVKSSAQEGLYFDSSNATVTDNSVCYNAAGKGELGTNNLTIENNTYCMVLKGPTDGYTLTNATYLNFTYYIGSALNSSTANCYLYLDGNATNTTGLNEVAENADNTVYNVSVSAGSHTWYMECNDSNGNIGATAPFIITATAAASNTTNVTATGGETTSLNTTQTGVDVGLDILTEQNESANVTISEYTDAPAGEAAFTATELDKYVAITSELITLEWAIVKVHYTDGEVSARNLSESSLRLWYYNATADSWTEHNSGTTGEPCAAPCGSVNTSDNFVWANTTHFSLWGIGGSAVAVAPPEVPEAGPTGCSINWSCTEWIPCLPNGTQTRVCTDVGTCYAGTRVKSQTCTYMAVCTAGEKRCSDSNLQQCNVGGTGWDVLDTCAYGCNPETLACNPEPEAICTPTEKRCVGNVLEQCSGDGKEWLTLETCAFGCEAEACKPPIVLPTVEEVGEYTWLIVAFIIVIAAIVGSGLYFRKRRKKYSIY